LKVVNDWAPVMTVDVYGCDRLITLPDQPGLLQIVQLVTHGALRQTRVLRQGGGRWECTGTIRAGIVRQAKQHMPGTWVFEYLGGQIERP
jgi:hypothetical protein